ncbi:50S ribosomal protein L14e [Candidatus Bathyarchaeota archaeon]|nr:50S ribosomal protein L14e [Candidatus Bathyarchaeota archaeon]
MSAYEVGRICIKTTGRDAGGRCVIVDVIDRNFVLVTGPQSVTGVRRRRVNLNHLKPLDERVEIGKGASDEAVAAAVKK